MRHVQKPLAGIVICGSNPNLAFELEVPVINAACSWKTFFARSTPIIIIFEILAVLTFSD